MYIKAFVFAAAAAILVTAAGAKTGAPFRGHQLADNSTITIVKARAIALKAQPGKITDQELEKERGGTGLRYSFDISSHGVTYEVGVDAHTGAVLERSREHPD